MSNKLTYVHGIVVARTPETGQTPQESQGLPAACYR